MKNPKRSILFALITAGAALAFGAPAALAQHDHDAKPAEHGHGKGEKHAPPATYAAAITEIDEHLEGIQKLITAKKLDDVHGEAQEVVDVANTLAALALKAGSGVAKENIKDINKAAKELAGKFDAIDKAGDSGDETGVKKVLAEMTALQATLKKFAPAGSAAGEHAHDSYYCPMHCEGSKTYDQPGKCPKCGMALKKQTTDKYSVDIKPMGGKIEAGKPVTLMFTIKDPTGLPVKNLEIVHEKPLHLLMVNKDLSWFAHEHPVLQADGTFMFKDWVFPAPGEYTLWNDITPKGVGMQVVPVTLTVPGAASAAKPLTVDSDKPKTIDGHTYSFKTEAPLTTGENHLVFTVSMDGKPVTDLTPYLGAMGHLIIISSDMKNFVHSHPHEANDSDANRKGGPEVEFEAYFEKPGTYKGWGQFQHMGKVLTAPFTFEVKQGDAAAPAKPHDHGKKDEDKHGK